MKSKIKIIIIIILLIIVLIKLNFDITESIINKNSSWNIEKITNHNLNSFKVIWDSMIPTFSKWDIVFYEKNNWNIQLTRWDLVLPILKDKWIYSIRRIIWLPWEIVKIENNQVYICNWNNKCDMLQENYTIWKTFVTCDTNTYELTNWFFLMWDNREQSTDSRCCYWLDCNRKQINRLNKHAYLADSETKKQIDELNMIETGNYEFKIEDIAWKVLENKNN